MAIGIDPGITGAVAVVNDNGDYAVYDLPIMANGKGTSKIKKMINPNGLSEILLMHHNDGPIFLERTASMPGQGVASMFSMGDTFGSIRAVCSVMGFAVEIITPQTWKKKYQLKSDKEIVRAKAIQLFPNAPLSRVKDHNRAEALLIAKYGLEQC